MSPLGAGRIGVVNRGEAAVRFIRALREYNHERGTELVSVALYTDADRSTPFVRLADDAAPLGPALRPSETGLISAYTDHAWVLDALERAGCDAVWPGWGFIAEDAAFVEALEARGVAFIGPPSQAMRRLGDKIASKRLAEECGVPMAPWHVVEPGEDFDVTREAAERIGYPLVVKASAGGGGRGIRIVRRAYELKAALVAVHDEALRSFRDGGIFLEACVEAARHIEVQLVVGADGRGATLGLRDCSIQRRHQKVIEESPSPAVGGALGERLEAAAVRLGEAVGYRGVGTVEFLVDPARDFAHFLEVNTRLQVEHTITEVVTGYDLVHAQLDIARGLEWRQPADSDAMAIACRGHAIELRLNAEDAERGFQPAPGIVRVFRPPLGPGIRVDSGVAEGVAIAPEFDSMVAKLIVSGRDRAQAIGRARRALRELELVVEDGTSNKAFLGELLQAEPFLRASADTGWLDRRQAEREAAPPASVPGAFEALCVGAILQQRRLLDDAVGAFLSDVQNGIPYRDEHVAGAAVEFSLRGTAHAFSAFSVAPGHWLVGPAAPEHEEGHPLQATSHRGLVDARLELLGPGSATLHLGPDGDETRHAVLFSAGRSGFAIEIDGHAHQLEHTSGGRVRAPTPALVVGIHVEVGDVVEKGQRLVTLEAMKMEVPVLARESGTVRALTCRLQEQVQGGQPLLTLEAETSAGESSAGADFPGREGHRAGLLDLLEACLGEEIPDPVAPDVIARVAAELLEALQSGFDLPEPFLARVEAILSRATPTDAPPGTAAALLGSLLASIEHFADVEALFEAPIAAHDGDAAVRAEVFFFEACRKLATPSGRGGAELDPELPSAFVTLLQRALGRYGVGTLDRTAALHEALWRLSLARADATRRYRVTSRLLRLLIARSELGLPAPDGLEPVLRRIAAFSRLDQPGVRDNARQAIYVLYDRQRLSNESEGEPAGNRVLAVLDDTWARSARPEAARSVDKRPARLRDADTGRFARPLPAAPDHPASLGRTLEAFLDTGDQDPDPTPLLLAVYGPDAAIADAAGPMGTSCHDVLGHGGVRALAVIVSGRLGARVVPSLAPLLDAFAARSRFELHVFFAGRATADPDDGAFIAALEAHRPRREGLTRVTLSWTQDGFVAQHRNYRANGVLVVEDRLTDVHPERARRLELWRLEGFELERLPGPPGVLAFRMRARSNPKDERICVFGELTRAPRLDARAPPDDPGLRELEWTVSEALRIIRDAQAERPPSRRYFLNRLVLHVMQPVIVDQSLLIRAARRFEGATRGLGLHKVVVQARSVRRGGDTIQRIFAFAVRGRNRLEVLESVPSCSPIRAASDYHLRVEQARRLGVIYPYEMIRALTGTAGADAAMMAHPDMREGRFMELDLAPDDGGPARLVPVRREPGENTAGVVVGLVTHRTRKHPEGMERVFIASDATRSMGSLAEAECIRIIAALDLAEERRVPVEWLPVSAGARIAMDSGTENLDWTARTLRRIIDFTQRGGTLHVIVAGVNVGAQSYWNAEATMLMHTRGALIMTPAGSMVLTGKKALEVSGSVAAEDERGIGGVERIMGPNGQAQYRARDIADAYRILFEHYAFSYVAPGERGPRPFPTEDPPTRDPLLSPYRPATTDGAEPFATLGEIFSDETNPGRKKPFAIREVMRAVIDQDGGYLERFGAMDGGETASIWDAHLGGQPVCLIGIESRSVARRDKAPLDGPERWSGGTLFPASSKKVARALNQASGNRPVVVLANLSGFDGSPESMRRLQLEYGAEIGRAVVNFEGPIIFVVIGRYHGGAYVVFSKALNPNLTAIAFEGAYASVIGGAPAAAVVFPREVRRRAAKDPAVVEAQRSLDEAVARGARGASLQPFRAAIKSAMETAVLHHQALVAREFDAVHSVERAVRVGSLDAVIRPSELRQEIVARLVAAARA